VSLRVESRSGVMSDDLGGGYASGNSWIGKEKHLLNVYRETRRESKADGTLTFLTSIGHGHTAMQIVRMVRRATRRFTYEQGQRPDQGESFRPRSLPWNR
jgi:hypothetical protein